VGRGGLCSSDCCPCFEAGWLPGVHAATPALLPEVVLQRVTVCIAVGQAPAAHAATPLLLPVML
jgi:hypothetical protein